MRITHVGAYHTSQHQHSAAQLHKIDVTDSPGAEMYPALTAASQHRQSSCAVYRTAALPVLAVLADVERVTTHSTNASGALCAIFNNLYKIGP